MAARMLPVASLSWMALAGDNVMVAGHHPYAGGAWPGWWPLRYTRGLPGHDRPGWAVVAGWG
jgi:hypothetical protein